MLASRKPLSNRDLDRLERVIARDLNSDPKPQYRRINLDSFDDEDRARYDQLGATSQEMVHLMADLLSDFRPRDRMLVLRFLVQAGEAERRRRQVAEQDAIEDELVQGMLAAKLDDIEEDIVQDLGL
jgi:hypothetical protein